MTHTQSPPQDVGADTAVTTADVVIGIPTYNHADCIAATFEAVERARSGLGGDATCLILHVDGGSTDGTVERVAQLTTSRTMIVQLGYKLDPVERIAAPYRGVPAKGNAVHTIFQSARRFATKVCVVIDADCEQFTDGWLEALVRPVLVQDVDFVAPLYARQRFGAAINNGVAYPLTRALYGRRVRCPLGGDFACSGRFIDRYLGDPSWDSEMAGSTVDLWLTTRAISDGARIAQAALGVKRQAWREAGNDVGQALAPVLGTLFQSAQRWQSVWQKVRGSESVPVSGKAKTEDDFPVTVDAKRGIDSFRFAQRNLLEIWKLILPPRTLLELQRLAAMSDDQFRLADDVWARVVYDFSLAYQQRTLNREHVLAAFTPLFSAWMSSFALEVQHATAADAEERLEQMCVTFEAEKPYLISRWRWPDRFMP
jgi:glucosylglycerate synthase